MLTLAIHEHCVEIKSGTKIMDIIKDREDREHIYAGVLNGKLHDLNYQIKQSGTLRFVYDTSETGRLIYERTLSFLLIAAVCELDKDAIVHVEHSLSDGQYCEIEKDGFLSPKDVRNIEQKMKEIIKRKEVIFRNVVSTQDAVTLFCAKGMKDKAQLLKNRKSKSSSIYTLCGYEDYFYGIMLPDTSYIQHFSIRYYAPGLWLSPSDTFKNQTKLFQVFQEYEEWGKLIGVSNVSSLNQNIIDGKMDDMVLMSETMVEKKLSELASNIVTQHAHTKFILIAGPSSAGKTSFANRLSIHLKILGKNPVAISMDNYYRNREDCPKLADGSYDFESLEALDLTLFNETMLKLLHKQPVKLPVFNFMTGMREWQSHEIVLQEEDILIIEGIHGLNPQTSAYLPEDAKFKIYINALTHLNLDEHNRIPTSDYRLIRRIARDYRTRTWSAQSTIHFWKNVKHGEDTYIYPYQEEADVIFNTSMIYELSILKKTVVPLLAQVKPEEVEYLEANRLNKFLEYFVEGEEGAIPRHSILAEFIGNSIFDVS
ncbi:nucleoside kinase [Amedibacillus sp. YH-ame6]